MLKESFHCVYFHANSLFILMITVHADSSLVTAVRDSKLDSDQHKDEAAMKLCSV